MLTVQAIANLTPIENADNIELARVLGWNVIVGKGQFTVGQKVGYFEIDSFLPASDKRFAAFQPRGQNINVNEDGSEELGHVLRTAKMRGVYSQGLIMGLDELGYTPGHIDELRVGANISEANKIVKWEEPIPETKEVIGRFESRWMPKSGAERIQNLSKQWEEISTLDWEASVKVDGTSQTLLNDGASVRIFGHNWELDKNTSEAYRVAVESKLVQEIAEFPTMAIQFELVGPGIHKNRLKLTEKKAFVFAVWLNGAKLPRNEWPVIALKLATPLLPDLKVSGSLDEMVEVVSELRGSITKDVLDEGVVFHLLSNKIPMWMARGASFKIVSPKYCVKHKL
jgi:RNA ligase (TIGR02306 family)